MSYVLFTLFVFVCVWCSAHIALCFYTPAPPEGGGGAVNCFTSVHPSIRPRYFSSHFSQQLLMAEI